MNDPFTGGNSEILPNDPSVAHNFGITIFNHTVVGAGGLYETPKMKGFYKKRDVKSRGSPDGIQVFAASPSRGEMWNQVSTVLGTHPGCVEARRNPRKPKKNFFACEFDGRVSIAYLNQRVFMYVRANTKNQGGGRFVQVTYAASAHGPWSSFQLIHFVGYTPQNIEHGNIYFAAVSSNPVDPSTLVGLFPVHWQTGEATIAMAISCDGYIRLIILWSFIPLTLISNVLLRINFSELVSILRSSAGLNGRVTDMPVVSCTPLPLASMF